MCQTSPAFQHVFWLVHLSFKTSPQRSDLGRRIQSDQFFVFGSGADANKFDSQFFAIVLAGAKLLQDIDRVSLKISVHFIRTVDRRLGVEQLRHHASQLLLACCRNLIEPKANLPLESKQCRNSQSINIVFVFVDVH